jgi:hypothetical protein
VALDVYAFVAITASFTTLESLFKMVESDNNRRKQTLDTDGYVPRRYLDVSYHGPLPTPLLKDPIHEKFNNESFLDPEFELVALHPEHFLPNNTTLTVYGPNGNRKEYVPSADRRLRESRDPASPAFPPFRPNTAHRQLKRDRINPFFVILNAELKFRRYFTMINEREPPGVPLPEDVLRLMHRTIELVDLLYWEKEKPRRARKKGSNGLGDEWKDFDWDTADLETRMAYGSALMSGIDPKN